MRQKSEAMVWVTLLALVPGCALFDRGYGSAPKVDDEIIVIDESPVRAPKNTIEQVVETPRNFEYQPTVQLLPGPPRSVEPLPTLEEGKKPGIVGTLTAEQISRTAPTVDNMIDAMGVKKTSAQGPAPAPAVGRNSDLAPLVLALQLMIDNRHPEAIQALRAYDDETQEFFLRLLPPLTVFAKTPISKLSPQEIQLVQELLYSLRDQLRTRCALDVNRMTYCKSIEGFGNYVPLPDNYAFLKASGNSPGEKVQLYVELRNFASIKGTDGIYLTKLSCKLQLKDANNKEVWKWAFDPKETTHRRSACLNDYHGSFSFYVPSIPAGTYKLDLTVVDETLPDVRRVAHKSLDFRVTPVANQATLR
ncbi:MAG TPA: hypothetical protein VFE62_15340 [Gemmataceae bacterium]|nr:hypothetical protein [Gemmataceae bacterium]